MDRTVPHFGHGIFLKTSLALAATILLWSCDKLDVPDPGVFQYPLSLAVQSKKSVAELTWSEATVSTFEEYIILRSTDYIPDTPEPEVTGNTIIIARLDEREVTQFKDSNLPIADTLYYKVYARIEGRLLMSPTISFAQSLQLVPVRADIVEHAASKNAFIAFDRATQRLYVYDYTTREFLASKVFQGLNFPIIRFDESTNEILLNENSTTQFVDYATLNVKQTLQNNFSRNAEYVNGWLYLTRAQFPYGFALYRRSDLILKDELTTLQADWRGFSVIPDETDANKSTIYDFSLSGSARYTQNNTNLEVDLVSSELFSGGAIVVATHPHRTEFVVTNTGIVVDENLQIIHTIENGTTGFSFYAYSPDGTKLFALTFQNSSVIRVYDVDNEYAFLEEFEMNNQISPMSLFADEDNVYLVSIVFLNTSVQTLITTLEY